MTTVVRNALKAVEQVLLKGGTDGADLAAILSALRGPDEIPKVYLKTGTTAVIRSLAFPRLARKATTRDWGTFGLDGIWEMRADRNPTVVPLDEDAGGHFVSHVKRAVRALERKPKLGRPRKVAR